MPAQIEMSRPSIFERLTNQKRDLERRLKEINEALEAINKTPEIKAAFEAISKVY